MNPPRPRSLFWLPLAASLAGCFNSSSYTPVLTNVTSGTEYGSGSPLVPTGTTRIFVFGRFLFPDTAVYKDGRLQRTTYLASPPLSALDPAAGGPALQVDVDADATRIAGAFLLTAMGSDTLRSAPLRVVVSDAPLALTDVAPGQFALGAPATTIVLTGAGFTPSSQVFWNGSALATAFVSSTSVSAFVPGPLLSVAGDAIVEIRRRTCRTNPCVSDLARTICTVGSASKVVVPSEASALAWDGTHSLLFAILQNPRSGFGLVTIDPRTGVVGAGVEVQGSADLSVSDGDQYIFLASSFSAKRYSLPALTDAVVFPNLNAGRVAAAPGAPQTAAFSDVGFLRIVDGSTVLPNAAQSSFEESIVWGADASKLYGISPDFDGVQTYAADASGVTAGGRLGSSRFPIRNSLAFDRVRRRIYAGGGENFDEQGGDPRPFAIASSDQCQIAVDSALGKAFFACAQFDSGLTVRSFDLQTQQQIAAIVLLSDDHSTVLRAIRWGNAGLAIAVAGRTYLYSGQFVR